MVRQLRVLGLAATAGLALALVVPIAAKQMREPTRDNPLRFRAFNVSLGTGIAGTTDIVIERWSAPEERESLLAVVKTLTPGRRGQEPLVNALRDVSLRTGFIRTANSLGWDLRYAREVVLPDGVTQMVIATDRPVSFRAVANSARSMDYPFTVIEIRMKPGEDGEGRMLAGTSIMARDGRIELEHFGREPVQLTNVRLTN